ncbi:MULTISPECIES: type II toxin-antitoxin system RelE/ParE family toxin [Oenococcus]|uniref:type II toxin-antitoxin system RelE/ParE family toxin n=1 Tax=Oenococcus TaxID=46254 RepID=UPI003991E1AB
MKKNHLARDEEQVKQEFENKIIEYLSQRPDTRIFPKSGAGIGHVWKIRVIENDYRIIYYAKRGQDIFALIIFAKASEENLSSDEKKLIKKLVERIEQKHG